MTAAIKVVLVAVIIFMVIGFSVNDSKKLPAYELISTTGSVPVEVKQDESVNVASFELIYTEPIQNVEIVNNSIFNSFTVEYIGEEQNQTITEGVPQIFR